MQKIIEKKKDDFLLKNEKESDQYCQDKLNLLSKALMENISTGTFFVPGGYQLYMEARKKVEEDYRQVPRKGVKVRSRVAWESPESNIKNALKQGVRK